MIDFTIDPTHMRRWDLHYTIFHPKMLHNLIVQAGDNCIQQGLHSIVFQGEPINIHLTHNLIVHKSEHAPEKTRIEVLDLNPLSITDSTATFKSLGTLIPEEEYRFKRRPLLKSRVVKMIPFMNGIDEEDIKLDCSFHKIIKELHTKDPVFCKQAGFLIMRHLPPTVDTPTPELIEDSSNSQPSRCFSR